jgi:hypothetical protein
MGSFQNYKRIGSRYHALLMVKILWCSQSGDLPENNLAKFGYVIDMKFGRGKKKKTEFFYVLGYLLELIIKIWRFLELFFFKIWQIWGYFFLHEKSFV